MFEKFETQRLLMRKIEKNDFDEIFTMLGDPEVMYAWEHGFSENECRQWIDKNLARYKNNEVSYLFVSEKTSGKFVGVIGALIENIDNKNYYGLAYILKKEFWGKGYAKEGALLSIKYCFEKLGATEVIADIRPQNINSIRVAKSLGMEKSSQHIKIYNDKQMPHDIYKITSLEYFSKKDVK